MKRLTVEDIKERLGSRPIIVLGEYEGYHTKIKWRCSNCSHVWQAEPASVIHNKTGCPNCIGRCQSLETMKALAKARGFQFLSFAYKTMHTKYQWKCPDGHKWDATANHVKNGTGCPYCNNKYVQEEKCRFIFEYLTRKKFDKNRSILGDRLELDGYCEELKIAFEYQGKQHFRKVSYWHKSTDDLFRQQARDKNKTERCIKLGIDLLIIRWDCNNIEQFIRTYLQKRSLSYHGAIDWTEFRDNPSRLKEVQGAANYLRVECLSKKYIAARDPMEFRCKKCDRRWTSTPNDIKNGYGCLACGGKMKKDISEVRDRGQLLDLDLISSKYINARTKHKWKCLTCNHTFMRVPSDIQQGKSCPKCGIAKRGRKRSNAENNK